MRFMDLHIIVSRGFIFLQIVCSLSEHAKSSGFASFLIYFCRCTVFVDSYKSFRLTGLPLNLTQSWMAISKRSSHLLSLFESVWAKKMLGPTWAVFVYLSLVSTSCGKVGRDVMICCRSTISYLSRWTAKKFSWRHLKTTAGWRRYPSCLEDFPVKYSADCTHTQILWVGIWQIWHKNSFADTI